MYKLVVVCSIFSIIQGDLTNLNDFLAVIKQNKSINHPIGFLSQANVDVVKRYLRGNINVTMFNDKDHMLKAIDDETIIAGITTGQLAQDLEPRYHVFSSLIVSPQAMLVAPDYNEISTPYGLKSQSSNDLFNALNAAIVDVQRSNTDETLLTLTNRTNVVRVYTCQQDSSLVVPNRNESKGFLRDILLNNATFLIGGLGPKDWGTHDGNYKVDPPKGFYPALLDGVLHKLAALKGPDGLSYSPKINFKRVYYETITLLFQALLDGKIHATDVYILIDAPYIGTGESCSNATDCRAQESCEQRVCTHSARARSLHFRTTCTTSSRDTKFIAKKDSQIFKTDRNDSPNRTTPKTRWIGFVLLFASLFGAIFMTLLIMIRRKKYYRIEHTLQGGMGKFARLQEEADAPMDGMDAFEDQIVQSPRDDTNSTS